MVSQAPGQSKPAAWRRIHWHAILVHFPISFFGVAFLFQMIHLLDLHSACFEIGTNVTLIAGTLALIPTTFSGWVEWKHRYRGAKVLIFRRKVPISFAMLALAVPLTIWRTIFLPAFEDVPTGMSHWIYLAGNVLLVTGAGLEGFYGGRLNHH